MATASEIDKQTYILKAVERMKASNFGVTGIKVEFEGQLRRSNCPNPRGGRNAERDENGYCTACTEGYVTCGECDGDYQEWATCDYCEGGYYDGDEDRPCDECGGSGYEHCPECDEGRRTCYDCHGNYHIEPEPQDADRQWYFGSETECYNYIMSLLEPMGLAEKLDAQYRIDHRQELRYGLETEYREKHPLVFSKFYNDHSVDSEYTFTIALDNPENIMLLPKMVEVWNKFVEAVGNGQDTRGAGMHMALIRDADCNYPTSDSSYENHSQRFANYEKSMRLLLPALFFLGSTGEVSRAMQYRTPQVSNEKYSAIAVHNGVLEFRVFETCYDRPEAILDNVVVMSNTLKYWSDTFISTGIEKVANNLRFGTDDDNTVSRFYKTIKHIDALNFGLEKLKPAYYTIRELKAQRGFKTTKRAFSGLDKKQRAQAELEYKEYEERFKWQLTCTEKYATWDYMTSKAPKTEAERKKLLKEAAKAGKERAERDLRDKQSAENFIAQRIREYNRINQGNWTLAV